jgi:hypothetical protein
MHKRQVTILLLQTAGLATLEKNYRCMRLVSAVLVRDDEVLITHSICEWMYSYMQLEKYVGRNVGPIYAYNIDGETKVVQFYKTASSLCLTILQVHTLHHFSTLVLALRFIHFAISISLQGHILHYVNI